MKLESRIWDASNEDILLFRLTAADGAYIEVSNYGATWVSAVMPDAQGRYADVLLGYDTLQGYLLDTSYIGSTVGRYANRLRNAVVEIEGITYPLEANDGINTNHGGVAGWHRCVWQWCEIPNGVRFMLTSPHLQGGFPGNVEAIVEYTMTDKHQVTIRHRAMTDAPTHVNMTCHAYFNLSGKAQSVDNHFLQIFSDRILDTNASFIPTGEVVEVQNTPFDFTIGHTIGEHRMLDNDQLKWNRGYNHCYLLGNPGEWHKAAYISEPSTLRCLQVETTLPAVLFYSAGYLESEMVGKCGVRHAPTTGFCLETQFYPDTPAHPHFPSTLLLPGNVYDYVTRFNFDSVKL